MHAWVSREGDEMGASRCKMRGEGDDSDLNAADDGRCLAPKIRICSSSLA